MIAIVSLFFRAIGPDRTSACIRAFRRIFSAEVCSRLVIPALLRVRTGLTTFQAPARHFLCGVGFDLKANLDLNDYSQISAFFSGVPPICLTFLEHATDDSAFIDIGANLGLVSAVVAQRLPASSIFSIEANPATAKRLEEQFALNCPAARVFNVGFSNAKGNLPMKVVPHDSGSCSMDALRFNGESSWHDVKFTPQEILVSVLPFDDWFAESKLNEGKFDRFLIKIDVEGHELQVLEGMQMFLASDYPALIICEVTNVNLARVREVFSSAGYTERRPCWNPALKEQPHHTDLVFAKGI